MLKDIGRQAAGRRQAGRSRRPTEALKKAIEANDAAAITRAMEQLTQAQHKVAPRRCIKQAVGGRARAAPGDDAGGGRPGSDGRSRTARRLSGGGDVIDAEVVDDKK